MQTPDVFMRLWPKQRSNTQQESSDATETEDEDDDFMELQTPDVDEESLREARPPVRDEIGLRYLIMFDI